MHLANLNDALAPKALQFIVEGGQYQWDYQYITGAQIKELAHLPLESELYLSISEPWKDELIQDNEQVDLARPGLEQFFIKRALKYTINAQEFESEKQYITGARIRKEGNIPDNQQIYLHIKGPWDDEVVEDGSWVDLARPGIEHFYSKNREVIIIVNGEPKEWDKREISFKEVINLAYGSYVDNGTMVYTVGYEDGPKESVEGSMVKGQSVPIKNKMIFHATATDKS